MSNSAVLFVPAARCRARVLLAARRTRFAEASPVTRLRQTSARKRAGRFQPPRRRTPTPPTRGGWSADRRTHSFGRACDARPPCPGATGTSLGAPSWRFSDADPRSRLPAVEPEPQRLPAPGPMTGGRGPDLPRCGSRRRGGRHSLLRLSGSFLENAPLSQDTNPCSINSICSQYLIRVVVDECISARRERRGRRPLSG
jgi:hypothetical protein